MSHSSPASALVPGALWSVLDGLRGFTLAAEVRSQDLLGLICLQSEGILLVGLTAWVQRHTTIFHFYVGILLGQHT